MFASWSSWWAAWWKPPATSICPAHRTSNNRRMFLDSWLVERGARGEIFIGSWVRSSWWDLQRCDFWAATGGGSSDRLSLGKTRWVTRVTKHQLLYMPWLYFTVYIPRCHMTVEHTSIVTHLLVAAYRHSKGCSVPTRACPLGSRIGADVPGTQLSLSATVPCLQLQIGHIL